MSRKSRRKKNNDLGFVSVRVMAEYGSSGLWLTYPAGMFGHGSIRCEALFLPPDLTAEFADWIEAYDGCLQPKTFDLDAFNRRGRELAASAQGAFWAGELRRVRSGRGGQRHWDSGSD